MVKSRPRRAQRLLLHALDMRLLLMSGLCSLVLASPLLARSQRCGDDVSGRTVPCGCGDVLVSSRVLGADDPITREVCPGAGLLVDIPAGAAATLDLGGQTIAGTGHGIGIQVLRGGKDGLRITGPGSIRTFGVGVFASGDALSYAGHVTVVDNDRDGVSVAGEGYEVSGCEASRNGRDGFALRGRRYRVHGNRALDNGRNGFVLAGHDAALGGTLGNEAAGNGGAGFVLRGRGHDVEQPVASDNAGDGIRARVAGGRIAGAKSTGNRRRGLRATGHELTVTDSDAEDNGSGLELRGARDGGGHRGARCRGTSCR
jgi:hypothetical protein